MTTPLTGQVVVITGGGRGIGRSHCLTLAALGAAVVVNDPGVSRDGTGGGPGPAAEVVTEIQAAGGRAVAHTGSVSNWDEAAAMIDCAVDTFGTVTGVVNNAGILRDAMIANLTEADWDAVIGVHLKGTAALTTHACRYWRAQHKSGTAVNAHIVNTTSGAGLWGNVGQSAYGAAKAGIANLTMVTALEARRYGVAVNAVSPLAATRITAGYFAGDAAAAGALDPARSSQLVAWLQSAESSWLTGQILRVDGDRLSRIDGFAESAQTYRAADGQSLRYDEICDALSRLYGVAPRGLAGTRNTP